LFGALQALTQKRARSAVVALIFALHPLAVESAAWIAERKNVLCALLWFLALWAYARYARTRRANDYAIVAVLFALSLLAKPMAVTFPAVLLLIDYWPLGRIRVLDKLPLFALSAIDSLVTIRAQQAAVRTLHTLPFDVRISNAIVSYVRYIGKTIWPRDLAVFYPYHAPSAAATLLSVLLLLAISAAVFVFRKRWPFLLMGWLWFLGTLVPMIGLVQVGEQSIADRYMYVAIVGLAIMIVWLIGEVTDAMPQRRAAQISVAVVICLVLAVRTVWELRYWSSSRALFSRSIAVAGPAELSLNNLGMAYFDEGDDAHAVEQFRESIAINPDGLDARVNLGNALARQGRMTDAIVAYKGALQLDPNLPDIHSNLGVALARQGRMAEAIPHLHEALRIDPNYEPARQVLDQLAQQGIDVGRYR
jgi:tetratricopeptide (TPR) repeat protein